MNTDSIHNALEKYNLYYRSLSHSGRDKFADRVLTLSNEINIIGRDLEISEEMEIILCAYFIQMTFGFQNFIPGDYEVIHIYESGFHTRNDLNNLEGKTFNHKMIALSWYHFSASHLNHQDGENLGYYHIAQALVQSLLNGKSSDDRFCSYFDSCAEQVFQELNQKQTHPFFTLHQDLLKEKDFVSLFPYLMEWFFEKPADLRNGLPNSYTHLCVLMNQDPLAFDLDYQFIPSQYKSKKGINPFPEKILKSFAYYQTHWIYNLPLVCLILVPVFYLYYVRHHILLNNQWIAGIWFALGLVLFLGTSRFFVGRKLFKTSFWFCIFSFTGLSPALLFLSFLISYHIPVFSKESSSHQIIESDPIQGRHYSRSGRGGTYIKYYQVEFEDGFLHDYPEAREFYPEDQPRTPVSPGTMAFYEIGTSIFGFKVVKEKSILELSPGNNYYP